MFTITLCKEKIKGVKSMGIKDKMKTYNFWISLVSALLLVARILGTKYGFTIDSGLVMDVTTAMCSVFVILGIISAPQKVVTKYQTINEAENSGAEPIKTAEIIEEPQAENAIEPETEVAEATKPQEAPQEPQETTKETICNVEEPQEDAPEETEAPSLNLEDFSKEELIEMIVSKQN